MAKRRKPGTPSISGDAEWTGRKRKGFFSGRPGPGHPKGMKNKPKITNDMEQTILRTVCKTAGEDNVDPDVALLKWAKKKPENMQFLMERYLWLVSERNVTQKFDETAGAAGQQINIIAGALPIPNVHEALPPKPVETKMIEGDTIEVKAEEPQEVLIPETEGDKDWDDFK